MKKVKAQVGLDESVDETMFSILEAMDENMDFAGEGEALEAMDAQEVPAAEQWVIMCHGEEDGEKKTEVWGPYSSKEDAVADLKDCIRDEFGEDELAKVDDQLGDGHVEVDGWVKTIVQMKSPESNEDVQAEMPNTGEDVGDEASEEQL